MSVELIDGPVGKLELSVEFPEGWKETNPVAICCHPHPLHGGSMQNKVVHILARTFFTINTGVVRFNFRGVGRSQGDFADGIGERDDLMAVVEWVRRKWPEAPLWLAGFSFGAYVAAMCHETIGPERLLLVAPAVDMYPGMESLQIMTSDWILIQGEQDEVVSASVVLHWAAGQKNQARMIRLDDTGHFFHGKLNVVKDKILDLWG